MEKYSEVSILNHGSYGVVQLVRHAQSGRLYAAKRVSLALSKRGDVEAEINVHKKVASHAKVVKLVDHFEDSGRNEMVLVMEYCPGGDLHDVIASGKRLSTAETRRIMLQLIDLLEFCHSVGVYHRDVKPENIFLHQHASIKLGDWGLATTDRHCTDFGTGSEQYMAPECFDRSAQSYDAAKADIWAVGIVLLNLLFGRNPFTQATARDRLFTDFASSREALYDMFPSLSADVYSVLRYALTIDPDNRDLGSMRRALLGVRTWTMDEEIELLEKKQYARSPLSSFGTYGTPPLSMVPVVHKPFRVPTAVARSLKSPATPWDRRMMFTPPSSSMHNRVRANGKAMLLPQHDEEAEDEVLVAEVDEDDIFAMDSLSLDDSGVDADALVLGALDDDDSPEEALEPIEPLDHASSAHTSNIYRPPHLVKPDLYKPEFFKADLMKPGLLKGDVGKDDEIHFTRFRRPLARKITMYR